MHEHREQIDEENVRLKRRPRVPHEVHRHGRERSQQDDHIEVHTRTGNPVHLLSGMVEGVKLPQPGNLVKQPVETSTGRNR